MKRAGRDLREGDLFSTDARRGHFGERVGRDGREGDLFDTDAGRDRSDQHTPEQIVLTPPSDLRNETQQR